MKTTMSSFQNMMILGALFPSVVDAYRRILDMIEIETARAICERRQMHFSLPEYGGVWGQLGSDENVCIAACQYDNVTLEPAMWRLTVRALLKVDVYGLNCGPEGPGSKSLRFSQMGLKDIIAQLEERSLARHAEVDAMLEAGLPGPVGPAGVRAQHSLGEEPHCKRIIKIAKDAIASLDIP
ncbi:putative c6 finger domain-containing protein [Diaporthe ampelina]|uniref:Putative c6 finger domain-containing protein n=1 Tax=Diaporthe ampelina TaxID=1214573 RepID=A0A0G2IGT5_9PEZI|nr:putative c6 finger domain-containing protein [Diaporthe ampelina]